MPESKRYDIFDREGEDVKLISGSKEDFLKKISEEGSKGKTLCIITKTADQAVSLYKSIKETDGNIRLCDNKSCQLSGDPVIMPLALTKGLEFDSVIVADEGGSFTSHGNEPFLYLASTRALHNLTVFSY